MTRVDTARLRELLAKATPGEWKHYRRKPTKKEWQIDAVDDANGDAVVHRTGFDASPLRQKAKAANAALIVALRNAAPALLDEVEALRAEKDVISKENAKLIADRAFYIGEADKCRNERDRYREALQSIANASLLEVSEEQLVARAALEGSK